MSGSSGSKKFKPPPPPPINIDESFDQFVWPNEVISYLSRCLVQASYDGPAFYKDQGITAADASEKAQRVVEKAAQRMIEKVWRVGQVESTNWMSLPLLLCSNAEEQSHNILDSSKRGPKYHIESTKLNLPTKPSSVVKHTSTILSSSKASALSSDLAKLTSTTKSQPIAALDLTGFEQGSKFLLYVASLAMQHTQTSTPGALLAHPQAPSTLLQMAQSHIRALNGAWCDANNLVLKHLRSVLSYCQQHSHEATAGVASGFNLSAAMLPTLLNAKTVVDALKALLVFNKVDLSTHTNHHNNNHTGVSIDDIFESSTSTPQGWSSSSSSSQSTDYSDYLNKYTLIGSSMTATTPTTTNTPANAAAADLTLNTKAVVVKKRKLDTVSTTTTPVSSVSTPLTSVSVLNARASRFNLTNNNSNSVSNSIGFDDEDYSFSRKKKLKIVGRCKNIEKQYLRLTAAPPPETVRSVAVLKRSFTHVLTKWSQSKDYKYACEQFKSLRQDLAVQHIKNRFSVLVYETHARIALEVGDLSEYNQCQSQLSVLYDQVPESRKNMVEFTCYRLLYNVIASQSASHTQILQYIYTTNVSVHTNTGLVYCEGEDTSDVVSMKLSQLDSIRHCLKLRSAIVSDDVYSFFKLYTMSQPYYCGCLVDKMVNYMRFVALRSLLVGYKPQPVPIDHFVQLLHFSWDASATRNGGFDGKGSHGGEILQYYPEKYTDEVVVTAVPYVEPTPTKDKGNIIPARAKKDFIHFLTLRGGTTNPDKTEVLTAGTNSTVHKPSVDDKHSDAVKRDMDKGITHSSFGLAGY